MPDRIVAVVTDVFFAAKVLDGARRAGRDAVFAKSAEHAISLARENAAMLVVDLNCRDVDAPGLIRLFKADPALRPIPALGFVSHVQEDRKREAIEAGCDRVVARSTFSDRAADLLSGR